MRAKLYKVRSQAPSKSNFIELNMEFDGDRAFVVLDSIHLGKFELKARIEIDPALLQAAAGRGCDYFYRGQLVLPRPEHN